MNSKEVSTKNEFHEDYSFECFKWKLETLFIILYNCMNKT